MKRSLPVLTFAVIIVILVLSNCTKDEGKVPVVVTPPGACDTITYTKHIKPLIDNFCISCHGTTPNPGAPPFTTYAQVQTYAALIKSTTIDSQPYLMPDGGPPLPQAQKDLIICWVGNGMKE